MKALLIFSLSLVAGVVCAQERHRALPKLRPPPPQTGTITATTTTVAPATPAPAPVTPNQPPPPSELKTISNTVTSVESVRPQPVALPASTSHWQRATTPPPAASPWKQPASKDPWK